MELSWDVERPPIGPPAGCVDRQRWASARAVFEAHQLEDAGAHCCCGELWPCDGRKRAVRALVTSCLQAGVIMVALGVNGSAACRWCGRGIAQHPAHGRVHALSWGFNVMLMISPHDHPGRVSPGKGLSHISVTGRGALGNDRAVRHAARPQPSDRPRGVSDRAPLRHAGSSTRKKPKAVRGPGCLGQQFRMSVKTDRPDGGAVRPGLHMISLVRKRGLEPLRPFGHQDLNLARLPITPLPLVRRF